MNVENDPTDFTREITSPTSDGFILRISSPPGDPFVLYP